MKIPKWKCPGCKKIVQENKCVNILLRCISVYRVEITIISCQDCRIFLYDDYLIVQYLKKLAEKDISSHYSREDFDTADFRKEIDRRVEIMFNTYRRHIEYHLKHQGWKIRKPKL